MVAGAGVFAGQERLILPTEVVAVRQGDPIPDDVDVLVGGVLGVPEGGAHGERAQHHRNCGHAGLAGR